MTPARAGDAVNGRCLSPFRMLFERTAQPPPIGNDGQRATGNEQWRKCALAGLERRAAAGQRLTDLGDGPRQDAAEQDSADRDQEHRLPNIQHDAENRNRE